ncbi:hypothetical protein [Glaciecola sp. SC05]|uniref:hypothetical protein n=1 Tax=Glaciecola sp. SC05 TaxID=1987355 RepID=UPI003528A1D4
MTIKVSILCIISMCTALFLIDATKDVYSKDNSGVSLGGQIQAQIGNDNNVVIEEIDLTTSSGDTFFTLKAKGDIAYAFNNAHSISASLSLTDQNYSDADNFDLQTILSTFGYKFKYSGYTFSLDYRKADAQLGGNDFLVLTQISPSFSFFLNKENFIRLAYTNIEKELVNNPARDAKSDEYGLDYYFFWKGLSDYFISSFRLREEDALDPVFNYRSYQIRLAYKKRFSLIGYQSRFTADARYRERDFDTLVNPVISAFRVDKRRAFSLLNELEVFDDFFWNLELAHVKNNSNLASASFSETEITTGFSYQF